MLVLILLVLVFLMFRISAASIIHKKAEKRRQLMAELEEEEPEPEPYDTKADLRVLAKPVVRPKVRTMESTQATGKL